MPMCREPTLFDFYADNLEIMAETIGEALGRSVTLIYRLKRIGEIGGIDLADMEQKVTLYLDFKTEKFGGGSDL